MTAAGPVARRPAEPADFDYCAALYLAEAARTLPDPIDSTALLARLRWRVGAVEILSRGGVPIGWSTRRAIAP